MIITIDGPAGTGKTTVAQKVAEALGYRYFDTGAMYRALTYSIMKKGLDLSDEASLRSLLADFSFDIREEAAGRRYFVGSRDVTEEIRTPEVTQKVSEVAALPKVREALVAVQQEFGKGKNAVFEGRDMGTVVFPEADLKIYLTARPAVRAERRYLELKEKDIVMSEQKVLEDISRRDQIDSTREISPLKQAKDARLIDTSDLTVEQVIDHILALIPRKT